MVDIRQHTPQGWPIAGELVGDDYTRLASGRCENAPQECLGSQLITSLLHQDVEDNAVLVDGTPEPVSLALDFELHFIEMPLVTRLSTSASQSRGVGRPELRTPGTDRLAGNDDSPFCQKRKLKWKRKYSQTAWLMISTG